MDKETARTTARSIIDDDDIKSMEDEFRCELSYDLLEKLNDTEIKLISHVGARYVHKILDIIAKGLHADIHQ